MKMKKTMVAFTVSSVLLMGCRDGDQVTDSVSTASESVSTQTYQLTVSVTDDSGILIEGADVIVNSDTQTTDANGEAIFDLTNGTYGIEVDEAVGYFNEYDSVTISGADASIVLELEDYDESEAEGESASIAASDEGNDLTFAYTQDTWDSGTVINETSDSTYSTIYELQSGANWGKDMAVIAWGNEDSDTVNITDYTHVKFTVDPAAFTASTSTQSLSTQSISSTAAVTVSIQSATQETVENTYQLSSGTELSDGWIEMEIEVPDFTDMTWLGLMFEGAGTIEITDVYFVEEKEGTPADSDLSSDTDTDADTDADTVTASNPDDNDAFIAYSGEDDTFEIGYWGDTWNSGTTYTELSDAVYSKAYELTSGTGWGSDFAVIAWGNDDQDEVETDSIDITGYNLARFKVNTESFTTVEVSVQSASQDESKISYNLSDGTDLGNDWVEMEVALPDGFTDMTWFGLMFTGSGTVQIADVYFVAEETTDSSDESDTDGSTDSDVSQPVTAAPTPSGYGDDEVFTLFSDTYAVDQSVSDWMEWWWEAPTYSSGSIDGNNYARYEIISTGTEGGVGGIVFNADGAADVSDYSEWNFDLYVEEGISQVVVKLVSSNDAGAVKTISNPTIGSWETFTVAFTDLTDDNDSDGIVVNTSELEKIGLQIWGDEGKAVFVDNIYFSGQAATFDVVITVTDGDSNPISGATVAVGDNSATTGSDGTATLILTEGDTRLR